MRTNRPSFAVGRWCCPWSRATTRGKGVEYDIDLDADADERIPTCLFACPPVVKGTVVDVDMDVANRNPQRSKTRQIAPIVIISTASSMAFLDCFLRLAVRGDCRSCIRMLLAAVWSACSVCLLPVARLVSGLCSFDCTILSLSLCRCCSDVLMLVVLVVLR